MPAYPPAPLEYFRQHPILWDIIGETAREQARRGKLSATLARMYASVWPARDDDLPGELWRPIDLVEGYDCSSLGRVRHDPRRVGWHARSEPTPGGPERLLEPRQKPGDWDLYVTLADATWHGVEVAVSDLVEYTFGKVAREAFVQERTGVAPAPGPLADAMPTAGTTPERAGTGTISAAGPPPPGHGGLPEAGDWRRVEGWPYDVNRAGVVRSYHDMNTRTIAPTPRRILRTMQDPALGPWIMLCDGKGRREKVAVAELVRRVFGDASAP